MRNLGFEYVMFYNRYAAVGNFHSIRLLDDPSWVAQWGYGLFYTPDGQTRGVGIQRGVFTADDPNVIIYRNLSESERVAWRTALWGEFPAYENGWVPYGCVDIAWEQAQEETPPSIFQSDEFAPLFDAWMEMTWNIVY
jgi:hypothetical protein